MRTNSCKLPYHLALLREMCTPHSRLFIILSSPICSKSCPFFCRFADSDSHLSKGVIDFKTLRYVTSKHERLLYNLRYQPPVAPVKKYVRDAKKFLRTLTLRCLFSNCYFSSLYHFLFIASVAMECSRHVTYTADFITRGSPAWKLMNHLQLS